jgi:translation initiation factor 2 alpha subunit (eIF-2alpha)
MNPELVQGWFRTIFEPLRPGLGKEVVKVVRVGRQGDVRDVRR